MSHRNGASDIKSARNNNPIVCVCGVMCADKCILVENLLRICIVSLDL